MTARHHSDPATPAAENAQRSGECENADAYDEAGDEAEHWRKPSRPECGYCGGRWLDAAECFCENGPTGHAFSYGACAFNPDDTHDADPYGMGRYPAQDVATAEAEAVDLTASPYDGTPRDPVRTYSDADLDRAITRAYREAARSWQEYRADFGQPGVGRHPDVSRILRQSAESADAFYATLTAERDRRVASVSVSVLGPGRILEPGDADY